MIRLKNYFAPKMAENFEKIVPEYQKTKNLLRSLPDRQLINGKYERRSLMDHKFEVRVRTFTSVYFEKLNLPFELRTLRDLFSFQIK